MSQNSFPVSTQTSNINFLAVHRFRIAIQRCPNVTFFCQTANLPGLSMGTATQATPFVDVPVPGDKIQFEEFTVSFAVDEDMSNYKEIANWIIALGFPRSHTQYRNIAQTVEGTRTPVSLFILDSNQQVKHTAIFHDAFPVTISGIQFDTKTEDTVIPYATASFRFSFYEIDGVDIDPDSEL